MPGSSKKVTLAIDIGGTGVKLMLLDEGGKRLSERLREDTPDPATPAAVLKVIDRLTAQLGSFQRVSVGFPGVVKHGVTMTAHNLHPKWVGFEFEKVLSTKLSAPVRIANDAAVQGYGAIKGEGLELVITLGTGFGSALFTDGHLAPGLELAHHPWHKNKTYEDFLGRKGLKSYGRKRWNENLQNAIVQIEALFNYDHLYIGGGNAVKIDFALPKNVTRVPNEDGLLGGAALWRFDTRPTSRSKASA
jgi:polyphosphate glucokinase